MEKLRIMIVDDSPFSIALIQGILEENDYEVVGTAGTLDEVKEVVAETKPALVTMDMTLPGTDGLECTRAIHAIDPNVKVIVISSMKDDEIVNEAKRNNVSAYLQKPFDADELIVAVQRVTETETIFQFLCDEYAEVFKEALKDGLNKMGKILLNYVEEYPEEKEYYSKGVAVIIGIIGNCLGRMLIDLSQDDARKLVTTMLRREAKDNDELTLVLAEFANVISGNACSILNRKNKALGLRVAPPSIMIGERVSISPPGFETITAIGEADFGKIALNVGFKRGDERWL